MSPGSDLAVAARAASRVLGASCFEVFAREAATLELVLDRRGHVQRRQSRERGVACRLQRGEALGFGRATGLPQEAGEHAARLALATVSHDHEPLPPAAHLGAVPTRHHPPLGEEALRRVFETLAENPARREVEVALLKADTLLHRSEGFTAHWTNQLLLAFWQQELAPGLRVAFRRAARTPGELTMPSALDLVTQPPRIALERPRGLARVLLAPDVAAPLLVLLARSPQLSAARPSPAWDLWDLRHGEEAFLPMACDGEGYPACNLPLLVPKASAPGRSVRKGASSRGAVRVPWDALPTPNPVHLWQRETGEPLPQDGLAALVPVSEVVVEGGGRFRLLALVAELSEGTVAAWGVLPVAGSLRRLTTSLLATAGKVEHVALGCVVSTPWLWVANLEVG
ncbi:MAG: hypothetical protein ACP5NF_00665 [Thermoanaerobaculum sp.]